MENNTNVPDLVDLLREVSTINCSDLHLATGRPPSFRKNGNITQGDYLPIESRMCREMVLGMLNENQRAELEKRRELNFGVQIRGVGRFRGNAHYSRGSLEATFRFIPATIPALSEIGLRPTVYSLCDLTRGLILVTGDKLMSITMKK
jgi:twitching motility protein PilT